MVKFNPDMQRMKALERLQQEKKKKEKELKEELKKQRELEKSQQEKQEEIQEVEKKLERAVTDILTEEDQEPEVPVIQQRKEAFSELESLEQTLQNEQREIEQTGPIYEINKSDLEGIGDLYQQVASGDQNAIEKAQDMLYHLNNQGDPYVSGEARELVDRDAEGKQYVGRLRSIMDGFDQQSDRGLYKK